MDWFYDKKIYILMKTSEKDNKGKLISVYKKSKEPIVCDVQPLEDSVKRKVWGEDILSTKQIFSNTEFTEGDKFVYKEKAYEVEKIIDWEDYYITAVKKVDIEWQ